MQIPTDLILFTLTSMFAWIVMSYSGFADGKGWPAGEIYRSNASWLKILAVFGLFGAPAAAFLAYPWWSALVVVVGGLLLGAALTRALKHNVQIFALVGLPLTWALSVIVVSQG